MKTFWVTPVFCFNEVYERLSVAACLLDEIHITDDAGVRKSFHCILKSRYRRDLGEITGELHLLKLLVDVLIGDLGLCVADFGEVCRPEARHGGSLNGR